MLRKQLKCLKLTKAHPELASDTVPCLIVPTAHAPVRGDRPPSIVPSQRPLFDLLARTGAAPSASWYVLPTHLLLADSTRVSVETALLGAGRSCLGYTPSLALHVSACLYGTLIHRLPYTLPHFLKSGRNSLHFNIQSFSISLARFKFMR